MFVHLSMPWTHYSGCCKFTVTFPDEGGYRTTAGGGRGVPIDKGGSQISLGSHLQQVETPWGDVIIPVAKTQTNVRT